MWRTTCCKTQFCFSSFLSDLSANEALFYNRPPNIVTCCSYVVLNKLYLAEGLCYYNVFLFFTDAPIEIGLFIRQKALNIFNDYKNLIKCLYKFFVENSIICQWLCTWLSFGNNLIFSCLKRILLADSIHFTLFYSIPNCRKRILTFGQSP